MAKVDIIKRPIENIGNNLKKIAWVAILESFAMIVLGIFLIAWPNIVIKVVAYVIGVFFMAKGIYQVINYFVVNGYNDYFNNNLLSGVISIFIGITLAVMGERIESLFRIVAGIWILYAALVKINTAVKMMSAKITNAKYVLLSAILMLIVGIFVTFYEGAGVILIGWMLVVAGLVAVFDDIVLMQNIDKLVGRITNTFDKVFDNEKH